MTQKVISLTDFLSQINGNILAKTATEDFTSSYDWIFEHNLGTKYVHVSCYTSDGQLLSNTEIDIIDDNTIHVNFDVPTAGYVIVTATN